MTDYINLSICSNFVILVGDFGYKGYGSFDPKSRTFFFNYNNHSWSNIFPKNIILDEKYTLTHYDWKGTTLIFILTSMNGASYEFESYITTKNSKPFEINIITKDNIEVCWKYSNDLTLISQKYELQTDYQMTETRHNTFTCMWYDNVINKEIISGHINSKNERIYLTSNIRKYSCYMEPSFNISNYIDNVLVFFEFIIPYEKL